jgi:hypothetical protein
LIINVGVLYKAIGRWNLANLGEAFSYRHTNGDTNPNGTTTTGVNQE